MLCLFFSGLEADRGSVTASLYYGEFAALGACEKGTRAADDRIAAIGGVT